MVDRKQGTSLVVDIFRESGVSSYIDYCKKPRAAWEYLEKPMWEVILGEFDLSEALVMDIGTGTGVLFDLLIKSGAKAENIFALEPSPELADYLRNEKKMAGTVIIDSTHNLDIWFLQVAEFDLLTANMVMNHLNTEEYDNFIQYAKGMLKPDGCLVYTTPYPEEKSEKHKFDYADNQIVVEEEAPWGGTVKYHHRSEEYQVGVLEKNGFEVKRIVQGYEDFVDERIIKNAEIRLQKNLRGRKRIMFWATKL